MGYYDTQQGQDKLSKLNTGINGGVQRLLNSGDPKAQALGQQLMTQYGVSGGQSGAPTSSLSLGDQVKNAFGQVGSGAMAALNVLARPGQAVLHGLQAFNTGAQQEGLSAPFDPSVWAKAAEGFGHGLTDVSGNDNINLRQTLNQDPNAGGRLAGAFDLVGSAALDPASFISGGTSKLAESGLQQLGTHLAENPEAQNIVRQVAQKGVGSLAPEEQATFKAFLEQSPEAAQYAKPQNYANDVLQSLQNGQGIGLAGLDKPIIPFKGPAANVAEKLGLVPPVAADGSVGVAGLLKNTVGNTAAAQAVAKVTAPVTDTLKQMFVPAAGLKTEFGAARGQEALSAIQHAEEGAVQQSGDTANILSSLVKKSGVTEDEVKNTIAPAILNGQHDALAKAFEDAGQQPKADFTRALATTLHDSGVNTAKQVPFELSKEGQRAFEKAPDALASALNINVKDLNKSVENRALPAPTPQIGTIKPEAAAAQRIPDLANAESKLQQTGLLKPGQTFLNHDVTNLAAKLGEKKAQDDAKAALVPKLNDIFGKDGVTTDEAQAAKKGFVGTTLPDGSKVYLHPEVHKAINDVETVINSDKTVASFDSAMKNFTRLWKGYAVLHPGFHTQNIMGNVFMNTVAGMRSPQAIKYYAIAAKRQKAMAAAASSGKPFDEAIKEIKGLSAKDLRAITQARADHIADTSYFSADQSVRKPLKNASGIKDKGAAIGRQVNPLSTDNLLLKGNRAVGQAFEHNARLAHYFWALDKTGSGQSARQSVNKYLFNYSELTPFERKRITAVVPFYTYMRKNTPLQLKLLAEHPGFYSNYEKLHREAINEATDDGTQYDPSKLANGDVPVNILGHTMLLDPKSPFFGAFNPNTPLGAAGTAASLIPGSPNHNKVAAPQQALAQGIIQPFGGPVASLAKVAAEDATGHSLGTGAPIKQGTEGKRLLGALAPVSNNVASTQNAVNKGDVAGILRNLAGAPLYASGDAATQGTLQARLNAVQSAIQGISAAGSTVPTTNQLRQQGKVAPALRKIVHRSHIHRAKTRRTTRAATTKKKKL